MMGRVAGDRQRLRTTLDSAADRYQQATPEPGRTGVTGLEQERSSGAVTASFGAAAAQSRNAESKRALARLTSQLTQALADEASGRVPGAVTRALNRDAAVADGACGTL